MTRKILLVSESKPMSFLIKNLLTDTAQTICVNTAASVLRSLREWPEIALLVVDLDFSTQENLDSIQYLNNSTLYKKPIVIIVSPENKMYLKDREQQAVFFKPFNPLELLKEIKSILFEREIV